MKRIALVVALCIIMATVFSGCHIGLFASQYKVSVYSTCCCLDAIVPDQTYDFWKHDSIDTSNIPATYTINVEGEEYTGEYRGVDRFAPSSETAWRYYDKEKKVNFAVDPNGNLLSISWPASRNATGTQYILSEEECAQIAKDFLINYADPEHYQLETELIGSKYSIRFTKYINGQKTADEAYFRVRKTGVIEKVSFSVLGKIPISTMVQFNTYSVKKAVFAELDKLYADVKDEYASIEYELGETTLTILENGHPALVCYVTVDCVAEASAGNNNRSCLYGMVVELT